MHRLSFKFDVFCSVYVYGLEVLFEEFNVWQIAESKIVCKTLWWMDRWIQP